MIFIRISERQSFHLISSVISCLNTELRNCTLFVLCVITIHQYSNIGLLVFFTDIEALVTMISFPDYYQSMRKIWFVVVKQDAVSIETSQNHLLVYSISSSHDPAVAFFSCINSLISFIRIFSNAFESCLWHKALCENPFGEDPAFPGPGNSQQRQYICHLNCYIFLIISYLDYYILSGLLYLI